MNRSMHKSMSTILRNVINRRRLPSSQTQNNQSRNHLQPSKNTQTPVPSIRWDYPDHPQRHFRDLHHETDLGMSLGESDPEFGVCLTVKPPLTRWPYIVSPLVWFSACAVGQVAEKSQLCCKVRKSQLQIWWCNPLYELMVCAFVMVVVYRVDWEKSIVSNASWFM